MPQHAHDWPLLSLFVIGSYSNQTETGERFIAGPSATLYAAGAAHRNTAGPNGFEQIEIEFDPAWLRSSVLPERPVMHWLGGRNGAEARAIASMCSHEISEQSLRVVLRRFLSLASFEPQVRRPDWFDDIIRRIEADPSKKVSDLARAASMHPAWLGAAYKQAAGEGLVDTAARFRVERATRLLRETSLPYVDVAIEAGFCDQSHMIRTFRRILGRRPSAVREDKQQFRQMPESLPIADKEHAHH
ncbi:MAG TPA: AraC family transcriptional regulator [Dyella sp.]|nr:AraC family transcriptional regulator [Dyella sp.]